MDSGELALELARKQKKLLFWKEWMGANSALASEVVSEFANELLDYQKLLSKAAFASNDNEQTSALEELSSIERKLTSRMEDRRLLTSDIGIAAMGEK